jgi:hypothetical protein
MKSINRKEESHEPAGYICSAKEVRNESVYEANGYKDRKDYLNSLDE